MTEAELEAELRELYALTALPELGPGEFYERQFLAANGLARGCNAALVRLVRAGTVEYVGWRRAGGARVKAYRRK